LRVLLIEVLELFLTHPYALFETSRADYNSAFACIKPHLIYQRSKTLNKFPLVAHLGNFVDLQLIMLLFYVIIIEWSKIGKNLKRTVHIACVAQVCKSRRYFLFLVADDCELRFVFVGGPLIHLVHKLVVNHCSCLKSEIFKSFTQLDSLNNDTFNMQSTLLRILLRLLCCYV